MEYPVVFENGVRGARLLEDVEPNEAFIFIPNKILLTTQHARKSEIGAIFLNHDALFMA